MTIPLTEARQAVEILSHAGVSPRRITRENSLIAWCLLIERSQGDVKRQAMEGLVNAVLKPLDDGGDQCALMEAAVTEINTLPEAERAQILDIALSRAKTGSREGTYACQLALMMTENGSPLQGLRSYFRLLAARALSSGRTAIECLPSLLLPAFITSFVWLLLSLNNDSLMSEPKRTMFIMRPSDLLQMLFIWCITGVAYAGLAVPTRLLRTWLVRIVDVLLLPMLAYLVVFVFGGWRSTDTFLAFILSMSALRLLVFALPPTEGLSRQMLTTMASGGGWASAVVLVVIAFTNDSAGSSLPSSWSLLLWLQLAAASGLAWSEVRSLPVRAGAPNTAPGLLRQLSIWLGAVAVAIFMFVGYFSLLNNVRTADREWQSWLEQQVIEELPRKCSLSDTDTPVSTRSKVLSGRLYKIVSCERAVLAIGPTKWVVPRPKTDNEEEEGSPSTSLRNQHMYSVGNIFPNRTFIRPADNAQTVPYYVCFGDCPARDRIPTGFTAAAILTIIEKQQRLVDLPPASRTEKSADADREINTAISAREVSRRQAPDFDE